MSDADAPQPPEEPPMEIHKPQVWPGWRIVLTDFVIVVLGVGVALAAQQAVESFHDLGRAAQARANLQIEVANNLGLMAARTAMEGCVSRRLKEAEGLIRALPSASAAPVWIGNPPLSAMNRNQYSGAVQSGAVGLLSSTEQSRYAAVYYSTDNYFTAEQDEQAAWAELRMLEGYPPATPVMDGQLRSALQKARKARFQIEITARVAREAGDILDIKPRAPRRRQYSVCIPLHTARAEGETLVAKQRNNIVRYDEP
jgi:hypothetical protein